MLRFATQAANGCMYILAGFPIVNYILGNLFASSIGQIWDRIVLVILALAAYIRYRHGIRPRGFRWFRFAGWYILYCVGLLLVGALTNTSIAFDGFSMDVEYIVFGLLIPFVVEPERSPKLLYAIVATSILLGIDGVFQYITKVPVPNSWSDVGEHVRTRVFSVFGSPAEFGANMEMAIPMLFALLMLDKHRVRRWFYAMGGACCLCSLLFTYNRGAWLGLCVGLLFIAVVYERRLLLVLVIVGAVLFFVPPIHQRVMDLFSPVYAIKSAQGGRLVRWESAFEAMTPAPLFGAGLGQFGGAIAAAHNLSLYSDSYFAKVLGESGLVGLVLFCSMHIAMVWEIMQTVVRPARGYDRIVALAGLAGIVAILAHSFVENLYEYAPTVLLYYMMAGLLLLWGRMLDNPDTHNPPAVGAQSTAD
ncbi:O-antigen ligase family protein [Alicyclobacillus cycloheptanicus]|nr:O-antigen ligase family protein [Alicyclobacillus cycloheptanicus]